MQSPKGPRLDLSSSFGQKAVAMKRTVNRYKLNFQIFYFQAARQDKLAAKVGTGHSISSSPPLPEVRGNQRLNFGPSQSNFVRLNLPGVNKVSY